MNFSIFAYAGRLNHRRRITAGTANPSAATLDPQHLTPLSFCLTRGNLAPTLHRAPGILANFASVIGEVNAVLTMPAGLAVHVIVLDVHGAAPRAD